MKKIEKLVDSFLPWIIEAGAYAAHIQPQVKESSKGLDNFMSDALTSADLSVQNFIEMYALTEFPECRFIGEEFEQSLNAHFFPEEAEVSIYLDPIDGTYFYTKQLDEWAVILSICTAEGLHAAIVHMPKKHVAYSAIKGKGATKYKIDVAHNIESKEQLQIVSDSNILVTFEADKVTKALEKDFQVVEILKLEYELSQAIHLAGMLDGRLAGGISYRGQLIDWGAIGFIAQEAGGVMSLLDGSEPFFNPAQEPMPLLENLVITGNPTAHKKILAAKLPMTVTV